MQQVNWNVQISGQCDTTGKLKALEDQKIRVNRRIGSNDAPTK